MQLQVKDPVAIRTSTTAAPRKTVITWLFLWQFMHQLLQFLFKHTETTIPWIGEYINSSHFWQLIHQQQQCLIKHVNSSTVLPVIIHALIPVTTRTSIATIPVTIRTSIAAILYISSSNYCHNTYSCCFNFYNNMNNHYWNWHTHRLLQFMWLSHIQYCISYKYIQLQ